MDFFKYSDEYLGGVKAALESLPLEKIRGIADVLKNARDDGKQVFVFGNGGSAATASHLANDLAKGAVSGDGKRFKVLCLSDNIPLMLAWGNDTAFENIFVEQLKNFIGKGDVVVGISGSGNSSNVLKAVEYANAKGATTIGLTGMGGGKLKILAQHAIVVDSDHMGRVEDVHMVIVHLLSYYLRER
jgi:D-sedoheptulose 7-phosphate isomerase